MATVSITVTLTVPNVSGAEMLNRLSSRWGYNPTMPDGSPNPQAKSEFVKTHIGNYAKEELKAYDVDIAAKVAQDNAESTILIG